mgnify:CR=1 FL=1
MLQYTYRSERTCYAKEKFFTYAFFIFYVIIFMYFFKKEVILCLNLKLMLF